MLRKLDVRALLLILLTFALTLSFQIRQTSASSLIYFDIELDEMRNVIYGSDSSGDKIDVISMDTLAMIESIPVGDGPRGIDLSPDGEELAIALSNDDKIIFLDLDSLTIAASINPTGSDPWDVLYGRPGRLYSTGDHGGYPGFIHVINTITHQEIGLSAEITSAAPRLAITPDQNSLYMSQVNVSPSKVYRFEITTDIPILTAQGPHGPMSVNTLAVSNDATRVYTSWGQVWSADLTTMMGNFAGGHQITYASGLNRLYVSAANDYGDQAHFVHEIDADSYRKIFEWDFGEVTGPAQVDSQEEYLYVSTESGIQRRPILDQATYIPLIQRNKFLGIHGYVKNSGNPAVNVALDLRFFNGSAWSTKASTTTVSGGFYSFAGVPDLLPGQYYYVQYLNISNSNRLYTWHTPSINSYSGQDLHIGDFDVANIDLNSPGSGAHVSLPHNFSWDKRFDSPTDSYEYNLFDYADGIPYFFTNPPLGYVGSYTLNSLPPGFETDEDYVWDIWAYDGLGGFGISYYAYWISFSSDAISGQIPNAEIRKLEAVELDLALPSDFPVLDGGD